MQTLSPVSSTSPAAEISKARDLGVTARVFALCVLLAAFFGWVIPLIDVKLGNTFLGAQHLAPGAVGTLLVLLLIVQPLLRLVQLAPARRLALLGAAVLCGALAYFGWSQNIGSGFVFYLGAAGAFFALLGALFGRPMSRNEMLTTYISCLFSCIVPGHGSENFALTSTVAPFYFASAENKWLDSIAPYLPSWATPVLWADPAQHSAKVLSPAGRVVADGFYLGARGIPWAAWIVPMIFWMGFILLSYMMLGCLSIIVRAQWSENEALSFPLNQLPLEMTEDVDRPLAGVSRFFHNPVMWMGFGVAVFWQLLNGLHIYFPDVPMIQWNIDTGPLFSDRPWNQMGWTPLQIFPIAIGVSFLLTSEIGFSLWFFALLMRFQFIGSYLLGYSPNVSGGRDFVTFQTVGAFFAYSALVMWTGRLHYGHIVKRAVGLARQGETERGEVISYPLAFWGFVLSLAGVMFITHAMGANWTITCMLWGTYLVMSIAFSRLIVEGGMLYVGNGWGTMAIWTQLTNASPATWLPAASIAPAALVQGAFMQDMRAFLMPSFVQGWKLAYDNGLHLKRLLGLIITIVLISLGLGFYRRIEIAYLEGGALAWHPYVAKGGSTSWAGLSRSVGTGVQNTGWNNWFWLVVGALLTWGMMAARARFAWFPLHPLGYLIPLSYPMLCLWFPIFIGWSCKTIITRFGGNSSYRAARPFFLGLAVGDIFMMLFWLLIDGWQGRTFHYLVPT